MSVDYDGEPQQQQLDSGIAGGGVTVKPGCALLALLMTILAMVYVYVHYRYVYRRHGEPPLLSGTIPWWGHAATFGKDPCQFVTDMKKKHGSVFTVVAAGNRVLLLCDYRHVVAFQRESKALSGAELKMEMTAKIFGAQMARADQVLLQDHRASYINHLSRAPLAELVSAYQDTLRSFLCLPEVPGCTAPRHNPYDVEAELELTPGNKQWQILDLCSFVSWTTFAGAADAIFGDGAYSPIVLEDYQKFDDNVLLLLGGLPSWLPAIASSLRARQRLVEHLSKKRKNMSTLMMHRREQFTTSSAGVNMADLHVHNMAFLFGLVANTSPAIFWTLLHLVQRPDVIDEIRQEIHDIIKSNGSTDVGNAPASAEMCDPSQHHLSSNPDVLREQLQSMVKLDSLINEMFRTCSAPLLGRIALKDCTLQLPDQKAPIHIRKGDRVCVATHALHTQEQIYGDGMEQFQWDRFLTPDRLEPRDFRDRESGEKVRHHLLPFGCGTTLCPGRHFARDEIKVYMATMVLCFDIKAVESDQAVPRFDYPRSTIGVIPPLAGDQYPVYIRRKQFS
ncbi:cytochrome P450 7A1-like [Sycon ciliatum]|uniref:cytochrome P450 7A1-like n=1 Tax=Sycon ciliatum TaxID=27933 RepID=UPI0031F70497